ncbi:hypothetical protein ElyMa_006653000 [Elysia marginata]|uniref:Secreted protein n=1 Tax=Elysia marginata TaxID=1093978 RepID=A0AAV4IMS3_9GAST|nr:hypothetical protein ElyMa_006653000 [Elysia marginata]
MHGSLIFFFCCACSGVEPAWNRRRTCVKVSNHETDTSVADSACVPAQLLIASAISTPTSASIVAGAAAAFCMDKLPGGHGCHLIRAGSRVTLIMFGCSHLWLITWCLCHPRSERPRHSASDRCPRFTLLPHLVVSNTHHCVTRRRTASLPN